MRIDRRHFVFAAAIVAANASQSALDYEKERVSQQELDEAIRLHGMWLADMNTGQRCTFGARDLSGLQFGITGGATIDLNGADFTQADLSGTEADDILVHHCSFHGATFDGCHWRQPVFAFADMRRASAKRVIWGTPGPRDSQSLLAPISAMSFYVTLISQKREYVAISMVQNWLVLPLFEPIFPTAIS